MRNWKLPLAIFLGLTTLTFAAGGLQNSDFESAASITGAGGSVSQLLNTAKIYDSVNAQLLDTTITNSLGSTATGTTAKLNVFTDLLKGLAPASGGGTTNFLRADGSWAAPAGTSGITALTGDVTATGPGSVAATIANSAVTNAKMANMADATIKSNISGGAAAPSDNSMSAILDYVFGSAQGSILYRDAAGWNDLGPGTSGHFLQTQGAGANPQWAAAGGASPLTTKGDIYVYSTTNDRLPVGTNGYVLSANSAQTTGLEWIPAPTASPTIFGSRGTPRDVVAGTGITSGASHMSTTAVSQVVFIQGSGGAVDISANPQIEAHTVVGARLVLIGRSDTNTVTLETGTGLDLNGVAVMGASHVLELMWDGTNYIEMNRNF